MNSSENKLDPSQYSYTTGTAFNNGKLVEVEYYTYESAFKIYDILVVGSIKLYQINLKPVIVPHSIHKSIEEFFNLNSSK